MQTQTRRILILGSLFVLIVAAGCYLFYYYFILPVDTKLNKVNQQIDLENTLTIVLKNQEPPYQVADSEKWKELQEKIPIDPLLDSFLVELSKVEKATNTRVVNLSISDADIPSLVQSKINGEKENPDNIKSMVFKASAFSPSYEKMRQFLQVLEQFKRWVKIESFSFGGEGKNINFEFSFTIYFAPGLKGLVEKIPNNEFPAPTNKWNPTNK